MTNSAFDTDLHFQGLQDYTLTVFTEEPRIGQDISNSGNQSLRESQGKVPVQALGMHVMLGLQRRAENSWAICVVRARMRGFKFGSTDPKASLRGLFHDVHILEVHFKFLLLAEYMFELHLELHDILAQGRLHTLVWHGFWFLFVDAHSSSDPISVLAAWTDLDAPAPAPAPCAQRHT
ncbi:hypothetical protein BDZ91DRAFT_763711 [Kalaharituber pfeilii]|nr:hypothetical protein BDZ91DRAFT_763711 [Kalaharituber pfeilii]